MDGFGGYMGDGMGMYDEYGTYGTGQNMWDGYGNGYMNGMDAGMQNGYMQNGYGMMQDQCGIDIDSNYLMRIGFTGDEIQMLQCILNMGGGKIKSAAFMQAGIDHETEKKIRYMYNICSGRVVLETKQDMTKHLRKMFGQHRRISIQDLMLSQVSSVPRKAVISGIKDPTFKIYNSKMCPVGKRMYSVYDVSGSRVFMVTDRKPVLKYGQSKKVPDVIEILELSKDHKKVKIAVHKEYCRLCNRYIIVGSLRAPEMHHGMFEILCKEGTTVYVYAVTMANKRGEKPGYSGGTQRVYDYGFEPSEIDRKLMATANKLYKHLGGVMAEKVEATCDFVRIDHEMTADEKAEAEGFVE